MKKFLVIFLTLLLWNNFLNAKIINIDNKIFLDVPNSHNYMKIDESNASSALYGMGEFFQEIGNFEIDLYVIGPKIAMDIIDEILTGTALEEIDHFKTLIKKAEKKRFNSYQSQMKWAAKELRKIMKKEKFDYITYLFLSKKKVINIDDEDLKNIINEHESMNNTELKEVSKIYKKEMTSLSRDNKTILVNEDVSLEIKKFNIAKDQNERLFLRGSFKMNWLNAIFVPYDIFVSKKNDHLFLIASECWINCTKFKFDQMLKPIFLTNTQTQNTSISNTEQSDLVKQLEALNDLYKSGVLTKEEFAKAKKKLLN